MCKLFGVKEFKGPKSKHISLSLDSDGRGTSNAEFHFRKWRRTQKIFIRISDYYAIQFYSS